MDFLTFTLIGLISVTFSLAVPLYEYEDQSPYAEEVPIYPLVETLRQKRSPQPLAQPEPDRNRFNFDLQHESRRGGYARADYNRELWRGRNGATVEANAFYQRNFNNGGPRQDYGGGLNVRIPIPGK